MSNIDKQALRQLATRATPGPWEEENGEVWIMRNGTANSILTGICGDDTSVQQDFDNARFIAAANPETVLALLDELSESQDGKANESSCADSTINLAIKWQMQCKAAEERVAELTEFVQHVKECLVKNGEYAPLSNETIDTILGIRADGKGGIK
ncbi:ead/Ea22-like family protein [Enterobacter asburiae]|uniref:ead/Ea22-like family protein n=1 Tax=Enterobacter cloacae complex TaxID=354276 RepID=UPI002FF77D5E